MRKLLFMIMWVICVMACKDETRENPPLKGNFFYRANPWNFYFVDGEGKDLIHLTEGSTLPTTYIDFPKPGSVVETVPEGDFISSPSSYSYGNNSVQYNSEQHLFAWTTYVPGNLWITESEFYVMFNRTDVDTLRVRFKFTPGGAVGGDGVAVDIREMYYNNILIIKNDNYLNGANGIFLQKQDGKTTVWQRDELNSFETTN